MYQLAIRPIVALCSLTATKQLFKIMTMTGDRYEPSALTAAISGGDVLPCQSEHIPSGADAIAAEA